MTEGRGPRLARGSVKPFQTGLLAPFNVCGGHGENRVQVQPRDSTLRLGRDKPLCHPQRPALHGNVGLEKGLEREDGRVLFILCRV